jgi:hypothetical protein
MKNLKFKLLLYVTFFFVASSAHAQNLSLTCEGTQTMTTSFGQNQSNDTRSYQFTNGKFFGYIEAKWSAESINVILPSHADEMMEILKGEIAIDRLNGTVFEQVEGISKRYSTEKKREILIVSFKGKCAKATAKF